MSKYEYLIDKVKDADFSFKPFKHIIIKDFLSKLINALYGLR